MRMTDAAPSRVDPAARTFGPVEHPSLSDSVLHHLRRAVINGTLPPGERLLEADLADQFHVSRATIRQALVQLGFEGLAEVRPRRGAVVTRMSSKVAHDVCIVRGLLEGWAARTACVTLEADQIQRMHGLGEEMGIALRAGNIVQVVELDIEFHTFICTSDPNERLNMHWASLNASHGALMSSRLAHYNYNPITVIDLHNHLCDELATRDPDRAEAAVRVHYMGTRWEDDEE
jgi:DNA-binding GntR family transcriptional regulator